MELILFGATDFSRVMRGYFESFTDFKVVAYVLTADFIKTEQFDGLPLVPLEECSSRFNPSKVSAHVALEAKHHSRIKRQFMEQLRARGFPLISFVHPTASLHKQGSDSENLVVRESAVISPGCSLGRGVVIGARCYLGTNTEVGDYSYLEACVSLGKNVRVGTHSILEYGCEVADSVMIGQFAYLKALERISKNLPDNFLRHALLRNDAVVIDRR